MPKGGRTRPSSHPVASVGPMTRWIELDGVVNMRDLGGLPTHSGRETREGRLIRSDNLQDLSEGDVRHLVEVVGVSDVIDLRSELELTLTGPGPLRRTTLAHHHHSFLQEDRAEETANAALALPWHDRPEDRARSDFWTHHYLGYLAKRPDSVSGALAAVADSSGGAVVHCAAGKDRTGTVTALALSVAGVPDEAIVADYAVTAERIQRIIDRLVDVEPYASGLQGRSIDEQTPRAETMEAILTALRDEFGGAEGWLREQGWGADDLDRLRARLTD